eukprot:scaffold2193_cov179-Ochromonas_danica.AAC.38
MGGFISSTSPLRLNEKYKSPATGAGGAANTSSPPLPVEEFDKVCGLMLPTYFDREPLTEEKLALASTVWHIILNNGAPRYVTLCKSPSFKEQYPNAVLYFTDVFFNRLFDVHPNFIPALSRIKDRVKFVSDVIAFALSDLSDDDVFDQALDRFAHVHHNRGVRAIECKCTTTDQVVVVILIVVNTACFLSDGLFGEVLLYAFQQTMGAIAFSPDIYHAWALVYSRILNVVLPIAVKLDLEEKDDDGSVSVDKQNLYYENMILSSGRKVQSNSTNNRNQQCTAGDNGKKATVENVCLVSDQA